MASRAIIAMILLAACGPRVDPPGRQLVDDGAKRPEPPPAPAARHDEPVEGDRIASVAMRTWIYQEPRDDAQKLGYLRAGAVVERARDSAGDNGCAGGWYRIAPRGYVCVGKGASLDLAQSVVQAAAQGPRREGPLPYRYVMSGPTPPVLYFKLPSLAEQRAAEPDRDRSTALYGDKLRAALGPADAIPPFLRDGGELPKPYGADKQLSFRSRRGQAREQSAFGLIASYDWTGRPMGLTTELDLIALDRTKPAVASEFHGIALAEAGTPAFVMIHDAPLYEMVAGPTGTVPRQKGTAAYRSGWVLTGKDNGSPHGLLETTAGPWIAAGDLRIAELRTDPAGFAEQGRKWIDVSIRQQLLVAYEGTRPIYATLVSTGRGELGDPDKTTATVRGTFLIASKHVSATMDGDERTRESSFDLRDVPYIQYFYKGYALHGAYWHDDFGKVRSHGCINLAPADAAWLFEWTEPPVPEGWHGAINPHGTLVYTHA